MGKVINFHKVTDPEWLEAVIGLLKSRYTMISADQMIAYYNQGQQLPRRACLITVDDGDETSYSVFYPILKKHQVPAIFFVSPEKILRTGKHLNYWFQEARNCEDGQDLMEKIYQGDYSVDEIWEIIDNYKSEHRVGELSDQNMTLEQVLKIDKEGLVTIGAHTMDHPFLARESDERSEYEIVASIRQLAELLGHPILTFAYPNGRPGMDFGEREMKTLSHTSCQIAFSTQPMNFSREDSPYAIPRFGLTCGSIPFIRLKLLLGSHYLKARTYIRSFLGLLKKR